MINTPTASEAAGRRAVRLAATLAAVLLALCLVALAPARAGASEVTDGTADWGVKESFRSYVEGTIAQGSIETSEGATLNSDGTFRFVSGSGEIDTGAGTADVAFAGKVFFSGHSGQLEVTISNPRVEYEGAAGTLYADVVSKAFSGEAEEYPGVDFATLDLTGITPEAAGEQVTVSAIPAVLTENGAEAFAGFYEAGEELDPVSFTATATAGEAGTIKAGQRSQRLGKSRTVTLAKAKCATESCELAAPKRVKGQIRGGKKSGKTLALAVKTPDTLAEGERGEVLAKLDRKSVKKLGDGKVKLELDVRLTAGGEKVTETVKVTVSG